jgi:hypothetical protein
MHKGLERKLEHYSQPKLFECFWGDGYRGADNRSILELHNDEFFNADRGYSIGDLESIDTLQVGEYAEFKESGDHWVRRIA